MRLVRPFHLLLGCVAKQGVLKEEVSEFGKEFSYLNMSLVITKKKEIMNLEGGNIDDEETNLDIFVKNIVDSAEELSEEEVSGDELSGDEVSGEEFSEEEFSGDEVSGDGNNRENIKNEIEIITKNYDVKETDINDEYCLMVRIEEKNPDLFSTKL